MFKPAGKAIINESVIISCESSGLPAPSYMITHNATTVSTEKTHTIRKVKWSDAGTYKCFVWNKLGIDSDFATFTVGIRLDFWGRFCCFYPHGQKHFRERYKKEISRKAIYFDGTVAKIAFN